MRLLLRSVVLVCSLALAGGCGSSSNGSTQTGSSGSSSPLIQTKAVAPYGDPLCMALSPDQKLAFVGEGASLALLDVSTVAPVDSICVKTRLPLDVACFSLLPGEQRVFLCGGKLGLFELVTCPGLGDSCAASCASYPLNALDQVDHKLCVAAAAVHGHASGDLLLALFSAKDDSELRVYDLAAPHALRGVASVQGGSGTQAFALAADPADPNRAYVAAGRGGLVRIDLGDLAHIAAAPGPVFDQPDQQLFGLPASVVDVAIAGGFLYAAIDRGGLVEIDLAHAWAPDMPYDDRLLDCGANSAAFAYRIAALADDMGRILVAVATNESPAQQIDGGPFSLVGSWDFKLGLGNVPDSQRGDPTGCAPALRLFGRSPPAAAPGASTCTPGELCELGNFTASSDQWRSLALRRQGASYQTCECRRSTVRVVDLGPNPFSRDMLTYSLLGTSTSTGLAPVDGVVSDVDPNLLYLTNDAAGSEFAGITSIAAGGSALDVVPNTNALCTQTASPRDYCDTPQPAAQLPEPYRGGLFSLAHWVDPQDGAREWFVAGQSAVYSQCTSPCAYSDQWCDSIWHSPASTTTPEPGWKIVSFLPSTHDGALWQLRWWQLASPGDAEDNAGRNYLGSVIDPRTDHPALLHLTRSGIMGGYLVCDRNDLMTTAKQQCAENNGRGQPVVPPWMHVLTTHPEFDVSSTGCIPSDSLALTTACRVYSVTVGGTQRWIAVLSAGYPCNPCAAQIWQPFYQRAMLVFYDVTTVDAQTPPKLLRLAFGPPATQGNAFAVETSEIDGRTYAFAADMGGRLLVFDVSGDVMFPAPEDPSLPTSGLAPVSVWTCPLNPFDGFRDNVINVAVDPPDVYLATGRRGLTVLEFTPSSLALHEIEASPVLTPGLALGLVLRRVGTSTTLVVGDSRGGLRLYGRAGS